MYLFTIYGKNEKDNLTAAERRYYAKVIGRFEQWLGAHKEMLP